MPGSEAWALGDFSRRSNPPPLGGGEVAQGSLFSCVYSPLRILRRRVQNAAFQPRQRSLISHVQEDKHFLTILNKLLRQALQRDLSPQTGTRGPADDAHTAFAELGCDRVVIDALPYQNGSPDYKGNLSSKY